jgi:hypothetical protein
MKVEEVDLLNLFDNTVVDLYWKLLPRDETVLTLVAGE